jgi:photosystem II stability/assembly factor-like uncharacterized protein
MGNRITYVALMVAIAWVAAASQAARPAWTPQTSGVTARLRGVSAVNARVVWASGANGTVLRSADGGERWSQLTIPGAEKLDFRDIDAVSDRTAFVLSIGSGSASRIYKTTDAGVTWVLQFTNEDPKAFFDAMAFWTDQRGLAFSDSVDGQFVILLTSNGGRTWTRVPADALPPALDGEGAFAASGTNVAVVGTRDVWIGTTRGRVLQSHDGGRSWRADTTPIPTGASAGIFSIAFRDSTHGIVVGGDYRTEAEPGDHGAVTSDGGRTWTLVGRFSGFRSVVAYVPRASTPSLLAVGPAGADVSIDGGRSWRPLEGDGFHAFSFAPREAVGWGVGEAGRIARLQWAR